MRYARVTTRLWVSNTQKDTVSADFVAPNLLSLYFTHWRREGVASSNVPVARSLEPPCLFIFLCNSSQLFHMFISSRQHFVYVAKVISKGCAHSVFQLRLLEYNSAILFDFTSSQAIHLLRFCQCIASSILQPFNYSFRSACHMVCYCVTVASPI